MGRNPYAGEPPRALVALVCLLVLSALACFAAAYLHRREWAALGIVLIVLGIGFGGVLEDDGRGW